MTHPESEPTRKPEYPFLQEKIPVADGLDGFADFIENYPDFTFCPYIAEKDSEGWSKINQSGVHEPSTTLFSVCAG